MRTLANLVALGGRAAFSSRIRFAVIACTAALIGIGCSCVGSVLAIGSVRGGPYSTALLQQPALRSGLLTGLSVLLVPLVALIGQTASLGSPARNRRLALYRLLGATPVGVRVAVAAEAVAPAFAGVVAGLSAFAFVRWLLDGPLTVRGSWTTTTVVSEGPHASTEYTHLHHGLVHVLPTDVAPSVAWILGTLVLVPAVSIGATWIACRRVDASPLSVRRRARRPRPPAAGPAVLLVLGLSGLVGYSLLRAALGQPNRATELDVVLVGGLFSVTALSLVLGTASTAAQLGSWIAGVCARPALLIAGRRLESDPYAASRATGLVLLALVVAVSGQAVKALFLVSTDPADPLYADTLRLVDVAYATALAMACCGVVLTTFESISTRRDQFAVQLALGTPPSVLRASVVLATVLPLVPGVLAAATVGLLGVRGVLGTGHAESVGSGAHLHVVVEPVPVPWVQVGVLALGVVGVTAGLAALTFAALGRDQEHRVRD